jgi:hypothetical protein
VKITIHTPLGPFRGGETEAQTYEQAIAGVRASIKGGMMMLGSDKELIMVSESVLAEAVIVIEGCLPNPEPKAKPNLAVVE